ncbi:hypothetical protein BDN70DRAFT_821810 [Pholiota conissans]|uniref:Reverse transcriptase n=1 Tax=Pholiota conissans TaxID=109636 RepID=A0A9P6CKW8_9AGAR|nr:hypothetical protein BDN70DRAFT_821810 [Pholiota conissans]
MTARLTRRQRSILVQLRTGHVPLKAYLYRMFKVDDPICEKCEEGPETVGHFLKGCSGYRRERRVLRASLGGRQVEEDILGAGKHLPAVLRFIEETGRFADSHGSVAMMNEER